MPVVIGLVWAACVAALALGLQPGRAEAADATAPARASTADAVRPPLVVVRGMGPVPTSALRMACRSLLAAYPVRCEIRASRPLLELMPAWDDEREQLDARESLERLFRDRVPDALAEIDITGVDIFEQGKPYVFGLASLTDRVAIVSLARIDDDVERFPRRLAKLVLHEAGHTLGLHHHDDANCVMRQDATAASLDTAPKKLCRACHAALVTRTRGLARAGQLALDRARSHLVRGEAEPAREELARTLWEGEYDEDVLAEFGEAFLESGRYNEAISVLRFVLKHDEAHAQSHVNLGLAYQMRRRPGDLDRAIRHFERALELRPGWSLVATHLDSLAPTAQGP